MWEWISGITGLSGAELSVIGVLAGLGALAYLLLKHEQVEDKGYRKKVEPMQSVVVKNLFSGETRVLFPGNHWLKAGPKNTEEVIETITLKNEPSNPMTFNVTTADRIELGVDIVVVTMQVPETPDAVLKAALEIDYADREKNVQARILAALQNAFIRRRLADIYEEKARKPTTLKKDRLDEIEQEVNTTLWLTVTQPWGFRVKIEVHNLELPLRLREVAEEVEAAKKEGRATAARARAAGVTKEAAFWGEVITDALGGALGRHKKGTE